MSKIELIEVTKSFGLPRSVPRVNAVDRLSLSVEEGELLVLVGPTGCGKSTTLRLIAGLETCDSGRILIDGDVAEAASHKRNLALVFQEAALFPHLNVADNIAFGFGSNQDVGVFDVLRRLIRPIKKMVGLQPSKVGSSRDDLDDCGIETRVCLAAKRLGIANLLDRQPHQLSGGERQRVALGRAIVRNPAAFLFDEPLSCIDQWQRIQIRTEIRKIQKDNRTSMIYVTHDLAEAFAVADRIAVMKDGRIQQTGTPAELLNQPASMFVAQFLGQLPMNWLKLPNGFATKSRTGSKGGLVVPSDVHDSDVHDSDVHDSEVHTTEQAGITPTTEDGLLQDMLQRCSENEGCWMGIRPHLIRIVDIDEANLIARVLDRRTACEGIILEVKLSEASFQFIDATSAVDTCPQSQDWEGSTNQADADDATIAGMDLSGIGSFGRNGVWTLHQPTGETDWKNKTVDSTKPAESNWKTPRGVDEIEAEESLSEASETQNLKRRSSENTGTQAKSLTPAVGETIGLKFDSTHLHFFDLQTGQNLRKELDETK